MSTDRRIRDCIERAAEHVGSVWPLHSFVTANPLAGLEDRSFDEAVRRAGDLLDASGYPSPSVFRRAWEAGRIDSETLERRLAADGWDADPAEVLEEMEAGADETADSREGASDRRVDRIVAKWLAAFLDQGAADWPMPQRERGFFAAFCAVARFDGTLPDATRLDQLPDDPLDALERLLADHPPERYTAIFTHHLTALHGWTGFIKRRADEEGLWQSHHPITLADYLAVRLLVADLLDTPIDPSPAALGEETAARSAERPPPGRAWLEAWEASYREQLAESLADAAERRAADDEEDDEPERARAQLVFCIDTRSEIIRRHLEAIGPYETHGYAGFFGIPMRYQGYATEFPVDACPPIVSARHRVEEQPDVDAADLKASHDFWSATAGTGQNVVNTLKHNAATAFSFVESTGLAYGAALAARTLFPEAVADLIGLSETGSATREFCSPTLDREPDADGELPAGLTLDEKVEYADNAFTLMGWETFARVVVFVGHASQTANNPYDSSLDCGACAGNPGGPSARVLAGICNDPAVRAELADRGIVVPEDTLFVAGEHNTTTDEVTLYADEVPDSHRDALEQLRDDLADARRRATAERADAMCTRADDPVRETKRRAGDWAETRPEWGLAGNAAFLIGPRELSDGLDLQGRCFLHSYNWETDPDGAALEAIMTGPMVVTQWINMQYYFATIDPGAFGSGSKITQNPVGHIGVFQGNGGDLMNGLPLQSLRATDRAPYHQPIRLSTLIHAPVGRVHRIVEAHDHLADLLDHRWLSLTAIDPERDHRRYLYQREGQWRPDRPTTTDGDDRPGYDAAS